MAIQELQQVARLFPHLNRAADPEAVSATIVLEVELIERKSVTPPQKV